MPVRRVDLHKLNSIGAAGNLGNLMHAHLVRVNNPSGYPKQHFHSFISDGPRLFSITFAGNIKNHKI